MLKGALKTAGHLGGGLRERLAERIVDVAEELYGDDIRQRIAAIDTTKNEAGVDPFGFDPDTTRIVASVLTFFHRVYFRTEVFGIENVPRGRALFVANHSGQIPIDGMLIAGSLLLDANPPVFARSMVEKWAQSLPFVSALFPRVGQVLGAPDNARRLLESDQALLIFPEGVKGISKTYAQRYRLADFGLGFMRLAYETKAPIVPVAVIGGEEQYPAIADLKPLAKLLGTPSFPLVPQLFFGMVLPLPTRYRLYFGEPMRFYGDPDDDDAEVMLRVRKVSQEIERMLKDGLAAREHVFW